MAHVQLADKADRLIPKVALRYSRRRFGRVVEPVAAAAHHSGVLLAMGALETAAERGWRDSTRACGGSPSRRRPWRSAARGAPTTGTTRACSKGPIPSRCERSCSWRTSDVYDERERAVLEYAEAATATPAIITDELMERLHRHFTEPEIVELAPGWRWRTSGRASTPASAFGARGSPTTATSRTDVESSGIVDVSDTVADRMRPTGVGTARS